MNRIAFYAPLKAPDHPVPSGDRELARGIKNALTSNGLGLAVELVSTLRSYDGQGDSEVQKALITRAELEVNRLLEAARHNPWRAWVTYHNYYRAPDLIGPIVSQHLKIPYILIEASIAPRRRSGPWAEFARRADQASAQADIILYLTERDRTALVEYQSDNQIIAHFPPFLNRQTLPERSMPAEVGPDREILTVGMFRHGDKLASYQIIAAVLQKLSTPSWRLSIVGDGPARDDVVPLFEGFGENVVFHGQLAPPALSELYRSAAVFLWPGVNEAFGMVYLEAQAAGLPIVAQNRPGVRDVIAPANTLVPVGNLNLLAERLDTLLMSPELQQTITEKGRDWIKTHHLLDTAASELTRHLSSVLN
ncbi:MAG: glycosyltransferase family 4 protein [Granulosicoccus sp.]|nr:glycosyltransferase family 4 protein [Granulosicoccus sp.]